MNSMLNIILNHKKEIQKLPHFSSVASSQNWLQRHPNSGLRVDQKDLDGDGTKEVVLYNKAGKPVIVNGYKLRASDYPQRRMYWGKHPDPADRIGESYGDWVQGTIYNVQEDPNFAWRRKVSLTDKGEKLKRYGYRMPTAPRRQATPYSIFCKLIKDIVNEYMASDAFKNAFGEACGDDCIKFLRKIVSPISIYRMMFMKLIERDYYFTLKSMRRVDTYDQFKVYKRYHKNSYLDWFANNYLTGTRKEELRYDKLPHEIIEGTFFKGALDLDGHDPEDSIVFLIGVENISDSTTHPLNQSQEPRIAALKFEDFLLVNDAAKLLHEVLGDKKHIAYKEAKKAMNKFQKRAQASTKAYFKRIIELAFGQQAFDQWNRNIDNGAPAMAQNDQIAQAAVQNLQERGLAPGSPSRPPNEELDPPPAQQEAQRNQEGEHEEDEEEA